MTKGLSPYQIKLKARIEQNLKKRMASGVSDRLSSTLEKVRTLDLELFFILVIVIIFYRTRSRLSSLNFKHEANWERKGSALAARVPRPRFQLQQSVKTKRCPYKRPCHPSSIKSAAKGNNRQMQHPRQIVFPLRGLGWLWFCKLIRE